VSADDAAHRARLRFHRCPSCAWPNGGPMLSEREDAVRGSVLYCRSCGRVFETDADGKLRT
jgi:uncharacterized protein YbaR (Trm112 family)